MSYPEGTQVNLAFHLENFKDNIARQLLVPPFTLLLPAVMLVTAEEEPPGWRVTESMYTMNENGGGKIKMAIAALAIQTGQLNPNLIAVVTGVMGGYRPVEKEESKLTMQGLTEDEFNQKDLKAGLLMNAIDQEGNHLCSVMPIHKHRKKIVLGNEKEGYTYAPKLTEGETPAHLFWSMFVKHLNTERPGPEGGAWN